MPKLKIDYAYDGDDGPIILNFQNGYPTDSFKTQDSCLLENPEDGTRTLGIAADNLVYSGDIVKDDLCKTFLLIRNRETGKVSLIEAQVANLKPDLQPTKRSQEALVLETSALDLSRKFGSKKHKQKMEHREKLKVDEGTIADQLTNVTANTTLQAITADMTDYIVNNSEDFYIPEINRKAETASEVYDLDKILSPDQYSKILSEIEDKDVTQDYHPFIKTLAKIQKFEKKELVLALYASALLFFYNNIMKEVTKKSHVVCKCSHTLNDIVLQNFLLHVNNKRTRPAMFKDKALCHAIVFCLILNKYKLDLNLFASNTKVTVNVLNKKAKVTGATIVTVGGNKYIQLKIPLMTGGKLFSRRKSTMF